MKYIVYSAVLFFSVNAFAALKNWQPENALSYVYLTWEKEDTSSHITVNYHSQEDLHAAQVFYSKSPQNANINNYEYKAVGQTQQIKSLKRAFNRITLNDLTPNTEYYFVVGDFKTGFSQEYKFKTLPNDNTPVKFVTGGDMGARELVEDMMIIAAQRDPDFVAIGGDIAYADGKVKNYAKWNEWLAMYTETMVTSDGRLIPMALALGNHEVNLFAVSKLTKAPFYFNLFDQDVNDNSYFKKTFGNHTILYFLDSGFLNFFGGSQKQWLKRSMQQNKNITNQFAIYHIPLYPSHRKYEGVQSQLARNYWIDVFDHFKLDLAFENHDHTFKVTHPLKGNKISPEGTVYIGDGCWGRSPRKARKGRWYLEKTSSTVHVWEITASQQGYKYEAIDDSHQTIYKKDNV